jgi:CheY-like chemotaxis protein
MTQRHAQENFVQELHDTLTHLYDPTVIGQSPLIERFDLAADEEAISTLQQILIDAIKALKPDDDVPPSSMAWRLYHVLHYRYAEQFTQREVALDLALSIRQLRRQEKAALDILADYLWKHYDLAERSAQVAANSPPTEDENEADASTSSREQELEWLERTTDRQPVIIDDLIRSVLDTARPLMKELSVSVHCTIAPDLPPMRAHLTTLRQALLHIVMAGAQCAKEGQLEVSATLDPQDDTVHIAVSGQASPASAAKKSQMPTLEIVEDLIELSDGTFKITAHDESTGCFSAHVALRAAQGIPILAIDDNHDTLRLLERYLAHSPYRFFGTSEPIQVSELIDQIAPHAIILDVMLPGIDGWEMFGRLREHPTTQDIPVIICTILPQKELALTLGAAEFIQKPVRRKDLLSTLDKLVKQPAPTPR